MSGLTFLFPRGVKCAIPIAKERKKWYNMSRESDKEAEE